MGGYISCSRGRISFNRHTMRTIRIQLTILGLALAFLLYYVVFSFIVPFSWYVDIDTDKYRALDVCVGDKSVIYENFRTPRWGIKGDTYSQIIRFDDELKTETTIHRGSASRPVGFGYEPDTSYAKYSTVWFQVNDNIYQWNTPGEYGANEWITIYPLPLIEVDLFLDAENTRFNVKKCEN